MKRLLTNLVLLFFPLSLLFPLLPGAEFSSAANRKIQQKKMADRIARMKADPNPLFFYQSKKPQAEQEKLGASLLEEIKKMSKVSGFDSPDHGKIYQKICRILRQASNTKFAQMAHWNIHTYYLGMLGKEDNDAAQAALESFLYKYDANEFMKREAYDKLSMFAAEKKDWGLALFYSDKYLELKPNHYPVLLNKARALIKLGAKVEGKKLLEKIVAESPGTVQYNLAQMDLDNLGMSIKPADVQAKYTQTLSLIKNVAMAVERYHLDKMNLPKSLKELTPDFIKETNLKDAWGTPLFYQASKDGMGYYIASAGSDRKFSGFDQQGEYTRLQGQDIICQDGSFIMAPSH